MRKERMPVATCVFDAYGTLFDVVSAARRAAEEPGNEILRGRWRKLAEDWRLKQLQYTWIRAVVGQHTDFLTVTGEGLDWAMDAAGLSDPRLRERLLTLYRELDAYPEVPRILAELRAARIETAILSNGSPDMLADAVGSAGIGELLDDVLSVEAVGVFKPARAVYDMVGTRFGHSPTEVLFVSSNGWDAAAAAGYGFNTVWVNRAGDPPDRLPWAAQHVMTDLVDVPDLAGRL